MRAPAVLDETSRRRVVVASHTITALATGIRLVMGVLLVMGVPLAIGIVLAAGAAADSTHVLDVTATAYNSVAEQTDGDPTLTAWGERLTPGMKSIAVSRDLIELGLTHGVEVEIVGLPGVWIVRDKMAKRWRRKIDIYMGEDVQAAREWGVRRVTIRWRTD